MGVSWSKASDYESDSSYSEPESDKKIVQPQEQMLGNENNCMDSATDTIDATLLSSLATALNLTQIPTIENQLDDYEKVSLLYLLYDDPQAALQEILNLLSGVKNKVLFSWAKQQNLSKHTNWQEKFIEALCIIQNYQILAGLGLNRTDLNARFVPNQIFTSELVNSFRKALYFVCENLTQNEFDVFVTLSPPLKFETFGTSYLEIYLLEWERTGYIKTDNLNNLYTVLKQMEKFDVCDELKQVIPTRVTVITKPAANLVKDEAIVATCSKKSPEIFEAILKAPSLLDVVSLEKSHVSYDNTPQVIDDNTYYIDSAKPGVCLIINQENFYRDINKKYKHLLPPVDNKLESRLGTEQDKAKLVATFRDFGFRVQVEDNLTHTQILEKLQKVVESVTDESSLFVCIMSHGNKGVVYGVNSCQIPIESIQHMMCNKNRKNLTGRPKVLILQSCQGARCQKVSLDDDDDENVMDAPSSVTNDRIPNTADLFTFWATVPGYGAIRNKKTGSWFIQSLCDQMRKLGHKSHFVDICTAVVNDVTKKKWRQDDGEVAMVPKVDSTLRKSLYLPPIKI